MRNFNIFNLGTKVHSILMGTALAVMASACSENTEMEDTAKGTPLNIQVGVTQSRAVVDGGTLADGQQIGIFLTAEDGKTYDDIAYTNVVYKATGEGAEQTWDAQDDILLSATKGTLYAYYPYTPAALDMTAVPVETTSQTDWMYATPVTDVSASHQSVILTMNHALTAFRFSIKKDGYTGTGKITNTTVKSPAFATEATLDLTTGKLSAVKGTDELIQLGTDITLSDEEQDIDILAIPVAEKSEVEISMTVDGMTYTANIPESEYSEGQMYTVALTLKETYLSLTKVSVTPWNKTDKGSMELEKDKSFDLTTAPNGVYAVTAEGKGLNVEKADASCIGVAFISDNQKVMIAKSDATDGTNTKFCWGKNLNGQDVPNLANLANATAAKADYNGKANTAAIIAGYAALGVDMDSRDMCKVLETYNEGGYTDWYVPAAGQLHEFYTNKTAIEEALTAISGTAFASNMYWSSSEVSVSYARYVNFDIDAGGSSRKFSENYVRFVRDLQ